MRSSIPSMENATTDCELGTDRLLERLVCKWLTTMAKLGE